MQDLLQSQPPSSHIFAVPIEILFHTLIPILPLSSLLALTQTCKYFANVCSNETVWKVKLKEEFNYGGGGGADARVGGWKMLYKGMYRPRMFLWGSRGEDRLGGVDERVKRGLDEGVTFGGVPFPIELKFKFEARIVGLVAGGWSFHALDDKGRVFVWGALDGSQRTFLSAGYEERYKHTSPVRLNLPVPVTSIRCSRNHSIALDRKNQVWLFTNWGRPVRLTSPVLNTEIRQVETGWDSSYILATDGSAFIQRPHGDIARAIGAYNDTQNVRGEQAKVAEIDGVVKCQPWDLDADLVELPAIPSSLPSLGVDGQEKTLLVKLAAGERFVIGLTNKGHVLKLDFDENESDDELRLSFTRGSRQWEYLPEFSEVHRIQSHEVFRAEGTQVQPPNDLRISHISAEFHTFFAYSASTLLRGSHKAEPLSLPVIVPELQNRSIISVAVGDYHFAALTSDGALLTWGNYSLGALGLGDPRKLEIGAPGGYPELRLRNASQTHRNIPPPVGVPSRVRFDHVVEVGERRKAKFCFATTAGGWHTGALCIDLEEDGEEGVGDSLTHGGPDAGSNMPGAFPDLPSQQTDEREERGGFPRPGHGLAGGFFPFRVGHADRGRLRGANPGGIIGQGRGGAGMTERHGEES